jgi:hypothetical protein
VTLALFFAVLYRFFTPSLFYQPFDSMSYSFYTEQVGIRMMLGNHPLGHFLLGLPYAIAEAAGMPGRALPWLAGTNNLWSAGCIAIFFVLNATVHRMRVAVAAGLAVILGAAYFFWWYAGTADIYNVALLLQVLAWGALVYELRAQDRSTLWLTGTLAGLGFLAHQVNLFFVLPVVLLVAVGGRPRAGRCLASFFVATAAAAASGYLIFGAIATGSLAPDEIVRWLRGYVGQSTYGGNLAIANVPGALASTGLAVLPRPLTTLAQLLRAAILLLLLVPFIAWLLLGDRERRRGTIIGAALLQAGVTWLAVLWWEPAPQNPKFWMLCFVPVLLAAGYGWEGVLARRNADTPTPGTATRIGRFVLAAYFPVLGLLLLFYSYRYAISFQRLPNVTQQTALDLWVRHSAPEDVIFADTTLEPFLRYWAGRPNTVSIFDVLGSTPNPADPLANLRTLVDGALCRNNAVIYTPLAVDSLHGGYLAPTGISHADLSGFFNAYPQARIFTYVTWVDGAQTPVYRLLPSTGSCRR